MVMHNQPIYIALLTFIVGTLACTHPSTTNDHALTHQPSIRSTSSNEPDPIPLSTRLYWMNHTTHSLSNPCTFLPFISSIVNHTSPQPSSSPHGTLICTGTNQNTQTGNPVLHGEISAITNCTSILTDHTGPYCLTPIQAQAAFKQLTIYTNAESCPMCASAIRWAGFREYVYGTSIDDLVRFGWKQIEIGSKEVFERSETVGNETAYYGGVGREETDGYFKWQFDVEVPCPKGCVRGGSGGTSCVRA